MSPWKPVGREASRDGLLDSQVLHSSWGVAPWDWELETDSLLEPVAIMGLRSAHLPIREAEIAAKK